MKKLLLLITGLLLLFSVEGQILRYSNYTAPVPPDDGPAEMFNDGDFSETTTYWSVSSELSFSGGAVSYVGSAPSFLEQGQASMITGLTINTAYTISFDVVSNAPGLWIAFRSTDNDVVYISGTNYTTGHYDLDFTTPSNIGNGGIQFYVYGDAAGTIDNASLKEQE